MTAEQDRERTALVVEDASDIRLLVCDTLRLAGFAPVGTGTGGDALAQARRTPPDLVTLDLSLPDIDGIEVCRRLRTMTNAYIVILTARAEEADRLVGLEIGADDYLIKPFSPRELRARVGAMFRRPRLTDPGAQQTSTPAMNPVGPVLRSGELVVDQGSREVTLAGKPVALTRTEFDLLVALMSRPRQVWERETLARHVWHTDWLGGDHVIDVHVANLRHKLGESAHDGHWLHTVRGVGYRFGSPTDR